MKPRNDVDAGPVEFAGRVIMIGCGSIGQAILPLLRRHVALRDDGLVVLSADEFGRGVAENEGARFVHCYLKPGNYRRLLSRYVRAGDLVLNLSVDVSSLDLIELANALDALYVDTSIEPWPGVFDNPMLDVRERTNFLTRKRARARPPAGAERADGGGRSRRQSRSRLALRQAGAPRPRPRDPRQEHAPHDTRGVGEARARSRRAAHTDLRARFPGERPPEASR
jgi:hypothetical protein